MPSSWIKMSKSNYRRLLRFLRKNEIKIVVLIDSFFDKIGLSRLWRNSGYVRYILARSKLEKRDYKAAAYNFRKYIVRKKFGKVRIKDIRLYSDAAYKSGNKNHVKKVIKHYRSVPRNRLKGVDFENIAKLYIKSGDYKSAEKYINIGLKKANKLNIRYYKLLLLFYDNKNDRLSKRVLAKSINKLWPGDLTIGMHLYEALSKSDAIRKIELLKNINSHSKSLSKSWLKSTLYLCRELEGVKSVCIRDIRRKLYSIMLCSNNCTEETKVDAYEVIGWYSYYFKKGHLYFKVASPFNVNELEFYIDGHKVKDVKTHSEYYYGIEHSVCVYKFEESFLRELPGNFIIEIRSGELIFVNDSVDVTNKINNPYGSGVGFKGLPTDYLLNKKGSLSLSKTMDEEWQNSAINAYKVTEKYFKDRLGIDIYFIYGSLLGAIRDSDFIPHDDDLDVGYFSNESTPEAVKIEMIEIIKTMVSDGWTIHIAKNGGGVFLPEVDGFLFDVFPSWHDGSDLWMHMRTKIDAPEDIMSPVQNSKFKDIDINIPNRAELFLERKYGNGWRIPDPGYSVSKLGVESANVLARSELSVKEFFRIKSDMRNSSGCLRWQRYEH